MGHAHSGLRYSLLHGESRSLSSVGESHRCQEEMLERSDGREGLRNGNHDYGQQQVRKLPNANTITSEAATKNSIPTGFAIRACNGLYLQTLLKTIRGQVWCQQPR